METWTAIHEAAATLALDQGLPHTTVESIAALAGVSRRTFFNYFPTKEDAVLGFELPQVSSDALAEFQAGDADVFGDAVRLMAATTRSTTRLSSDPKRRMQLIRRFPELRSRLVHHASAAETLVAPILSDKLSSATKPLQGDDGSSAKALLMLVGTVVRFAYSHDPSLSTGNISAVDSAVESAIETFRKVIKKTL